MRVTEAMRNYIISSGSAVKPTYMTEIRDQYSFVQYTIPRTYNNLSRYSPYRQIIGENDNQKYLESINNTEIVSDDLDMYTEVTVRTENRLDMIAAEFYGYSTYWWILAHANNIIDPFNVPSGTVLRVPPIKSLYMSKGVVNSVN